MSKVLSGEIHYEDVPRITTYLQDCPNLPTNITATLVIVCRGLEFLITKGFNSREYQSLLKSTSFMVAVDALTEKNADVGYLSQDSTFDSAFAKGILNKRTFTEEGFLDDQINHWAISDGIQLLTQYRDFRLEGIGLCRNDLNKLLNETGLLNPVDDICWEDLQRVVNQFPALWCTFHWLAKQNKVVDVLLDIVFRTAIGIPDFNSVEYWLQRRAALLLFDQGGIAPFCENISSVRAELILFITLLRPVSDKDKASLLSAIDHLEDKDLRSDFFSVRVWLETGEL